MLLPSPEEESELDHQNDDDQQLQEERSPLMELIDH